MPSKRTANWPPCWVVLLAVACGSGSKGASSSDPADDTSATDTGAPDEVGCGVETGARPYTVVPLDEGDYITLTPSVDQPGGWTLGETLALTADLWGDGRPEVVSRGDYYDGYEHGISTTYVFDSDYFSSGPKEGVAGDEARLQIDTENGGAYSLPSVIDDIDGDGLDELTLSADGWGATSVLIRGAHLATLSGQVPREYIDINADMTFSGCPGGFAFVYHSGHLSDLSRVSPDLVVDCYGVIVVAHALDLSDGEVAIAEEGQVRIFNTDTWGGEAVVEWDRLFKPDVLGDIDGDGLDELAIPMSSRSEPYNYVFYGDSLDFNNPTSVLDADITFAVPDAVSWGDQVIHYFRPTPLSDVDGDGVADVLWGTGYAQVDERESLGIAWLWSGARLALPMVGDVGDADVTFTADLLGSFVGESAADVGDVDEDCLSDLLIHSRGRIPDDDSVRPFVHLVRGAEILGGGTYNLDHAGMAFLPASDGYRNSGVEAGEYVGGKDIDGDGIGDVLIGNGDWAGLTLGRIWMIPGGSLPL